MIILYKDFKKGIIKLKINNIEDFIGLKLLIRKGDIIETYTYRFIKDKERSYRERVKDFVKLEVEEVKFVDSRIKVNGRIIETRKDLGKGYIGILLDIGKEITLYKKNLTEIDKEIIERFSKGFKNYLIIAFDLNRCCVAKLQNFRYEILEEFESNISKENPIEYENSKESYFGKIKKIIRENYDKYNLIILASPLDWNKKIKESIGNGKIYCITISYGGENGIREVLRRKEIYKILEDSYETILINKYENFLKNLNEELSFIGVSSFLKNLEIGNIDYILILEEKLREILEKNPEIIEKIDSIKGKIYIVPKSSNIYFNIKKMGGIVGVLRFKIYE